MSSIGTTFAQRVFVPLSVRATFASRNSEIFMPTIDVDGVGRIAFPILPVQTERLVEIAEAAPYGRGEETVVDRAVRRTWQIDSPRFGSEGVTGEDPGGLVADIAVGSA